MRRTAYTLVELTFVIVIMLILAGLVIGGANYLMNQSRGQQVVNYAKQLQIAVDQYLLRNRNVSGAPSSNSPVPVNRGDKAALNAVLGSFLDGGSTAFINPFNGQTYNVEAFIADNAGWPWGYIGGGLSLSGPISGGAGCFYNSLALTTTYAGQVVFAGVNRSVRSFIYVWDGTAEKTFNYYAVQGLDRVGQPLITLGR